MNIQASFTKEKETKNTIRFQEDGAEEGTFTIGTLYIQKSALVGGVPDKIQVTITDKVK